MVAELALAISLIATPVQASDTIHAQVQKNAKQVQEQAEYVSLGEYRITTYCRFCNEPQGTSSASGKPLKNGMVAMNGVPLGTKIAIDGEEFIVADRCGVDGTVDIFIDDGGNSCHCDTLTRAKVTRLNE